MKKDFKKFYKNIDWKKIPKKYLIIIGILLIFIVALISILVFLIFINKSKKNIKHDPVKPIVETTTAYGIKMDNKCYSQFQDFIKNYGQDYSKCLVDFDFNEQYCGGDDPEKGLSDINMIVILDDSGSMAEKIGSDIRIDVAKKAVADFLTEMPAGVNTGLVVYGHKGSNSVVDKNLSCSGIEEIVKLGSNNSNNIITAINSFTPKGWTPIAGSLDFVRSILKNSPADSKNYVILVSDGSESCDGNPIDAAENLKLGVAGVKLDIIGLATNTETSNSLEKIATIAGGSYLTAYNSAGISTAFNKELLAIKRDCINVTFLKMSLRYNNNNLNNLNCWLDAYKKESDAFNKIISDDSVNIECGSQISDAIQARQNDSWYQKQDLVKKNDAIYNKIKSDSNAQLKAIDNQTN